ncbi:MAG: peptidoglycan-binding protein [Flavitalea sp.]
MKRCLFQVGDLTAIDTSDIFTPELSAATKQAQKRFGLKQDGIINAGLIDNSNEPITDRIEQCLSIWSACDGYPKNHKERGLLPIFRNINCMSVSQPRSKCRGE